MVFYFRLMGLSLLIVILVGLSWFFPFLYDDLLLLFKIKITAFPWWGNIIGIILTISIIPILCYFVIPMIYHLLLSPIDNIIKGKTRKITALANKINYFYGDYDVSIPTFRGYVTLKAYRIKYEFNGVFYNKVLLFSMYDHEKLLLTTHENNNPNNNITNLNNINNYDIPILLDIENPNNISLDWEWLGRKPIKGLR